MDILHYRDYEGSAELDMERSLCVGSVLFIDDVVRYETESPAELQAAFEAAVDDYVETSAMLGRAPQKPLKGQFNVRIPRQLHKAAVLRAARDEVSLNEIVVRSMHAFLAVSDVQHKVTAVASQAEDAGQRHALSSASSPRR